MGRRDRSIPTMIFIDLSARTKLRLRGADRLRFLNGQVTNDVRRATAGQSIYACLLTAKGKLCADIFITAGPDFLQVDAEPELREALPARLERYLIADDVEIEDATDSLALLHWLPADADNAPAPPALEWATSPVRSNRYGATGCDFFLDRAHWQDAVAQLRAKGQRVLSATDAEVEARRIAAGVPRWGAELDETVLLPEAGLEARAVDYAKGCYVGQEIVSRLKSLGHVNRYLRRLRTVAPCEAPPAAGAPLYADAKTLDPAAKEIGRVTSVAPAAAQPAQDWVALGYVRRGFDAPGSRLLAAKTTESSARFCRLEISADPPP